MGLPQSTDPSGTVLVNALEIAANVAGDEEAAGMEKDAVQACNSLEEAMAQRRKAGNKRIFAAGKARGAKNRTNRSLRVFGEKAAAHYRTDRKKGEEHPEFRRILKEKSASTYLPAKADERAEELAALAKAIGSPKTEAAVRKLGEPLLKAIANEATHLAALKAAADAENELLAKEVTSKEGVVAAVRALSGQVHAAFSTEPARIREVLGYAEPAARAKGKGAKKAAKNAKGDADRKEGASTEEGKADGEGGEK